MNMSLPVDYDALTGMSVASPFDDDTTATCFLLLLCCADIFNHRRLPKGGVSAFLTATGCTDKKKVVEALKHWLETEDTFPSPKNIRWRIIYLEDNEIEEHNPLGWNNPLGWKILVPDELTDANQGSSTNRVNTSR